ncbi:MAG: recombination protein RecR [Gammaproteobacteria bacterium]|nr:recombination protein RecR [Gammaproteobacteria bacterium]
MSSIKNLTQALQRLPGIGPKTAQRLCYHILERHRETGSNLSHALEEAIENVGHCQKCQTLSETDICEICANQKRNPKILCVVETPIDIQAIEQTSSFNGYYFVLGGRLSPLDGIGPEDIAMNELALRLNDETIEEVIIATNPTIEGEATAHYITNLVRRKLTFTRLAHGVPMGGELEYLDSNTLARALQGRRNLQD